VRRDWKQKAALQRVFSWLPGGHRLNYAFQRHVTHGLPIDDHALAAQVDLARHHVEQFRLRGARPLEEAAFFEFGAGWDFAMPLAFSALGVRRQLVVDLRRLGRFDLALDVDERVAGLGAPATRPPPASDLASLLAARGIDYRAPADARSTGVADRSIDCVTSTNTLEHIPPADITAIYRELHRIVASEGVISFQIDYQDHYSYFDPSISVYNFLTFDAAAWHRFNPSLHFQNRLRHRDHVALIEAAGFEIIESTLEGGSPEDLEALAALDLAPPFRDVDPAELAIRTSRLTLRAVR
jgi:hypothetical protein